jgi:hypothetical protein
MDVDENLDLDESGVRIDEDGHVAQPIDQEDSDDEEVEEDMRVELVLWIVLFEMAISSRSGRRRSH